MYIAHDKPQRSQNVHSNLLPKPITAEKESVAAQYGGIQPLKQTQFTGMAAVTCILFVPDMASEVLQPASKLIMQ